MTVGKTVGAELQYVDFTGGVDYLFEAAGASAALEVTRRTNEQERRSHEAASKHEHVINGFLGRYDWWVVFDGYPTYQGIDQAIGGVLLRLEQHEFLDYHREKHYWWLRQVPTLKDTLTRMGKLHVMGARVLDPHVGGNGTIYLNVSSSYVYGGADDALGILERLVRDSDGDRQKLRNADVTERHLWIWTDWCTPEGLRHAFTEVTRTLPSRPANLPEEVTHLWCVDEITGSGWTFNSLDGWEHVIAEPDA